MNIYIMPQKKYASEGKRIVYIKDIADVYSNKCSTEEIKNMRSISLYDEILLKPTK